MLHAVSVLEEETEPNGAGVLESDDLVLSAQVLQEFSKRATKRDRLAHESAVNLVESWLRFRIGPARAQALATAARWRISYRLPGGSLGGPAVRHELPVHPFGWESAP